MMQILHYFLIILFISIPELTLSQPWQYKTSMPTARKSMAVTVYQNRIWVMGGNEANHMGANYSSVVEVYDPISDMWDISFPSLIHARAEGVAQTIQEKIYVFGGLNASGLVGDVEKYDSVSGNWQVICQLPTPRRGMTSVKVDSVIWLIGGSNLQGNFYNIIEIYNPQANSWDALAASLNTPRSDAMSASTAWGIFVFGGNFFGPINDIEHYNFPAQQWNIIGNILYHCFSAGYTTTGDSSWIIGGMGMSGTPLDRVQVFYHENQQFNWWEGPPLNTARRELVAATINNKIYAIGGRGMMGHNFFDVVEELSLVTDISSEPLPIADKIAILENYPNPFNLSTTIQCQLPQRDNISIEMLTILGQKVKTLFNGPLPAGNHQFHLTSSDFSGIELGSGVYFIRLTGRKYILTHKIFLLK